MSPSSKSLFTFTFTYPLIAGVVWATCTNSVTTCFFHFPPVLHRPLGLGELHARPFLDVVFPPLFFSLSSVCLVFLPPFTVPCKMVLARNDERETSESLSQEF